MEETGKEGLCRSRDAPGASAHRDDAVDSRIRGISPRPAHPPRSREMNMTGLYCQPPWTTMLTMGFFSSACEKVYS